MESMPYCHAYARTLKSEGSVYVNQRSLAPVTVYVVGSALAELTGNIDKTIRDHFEILMILPNSFFINTLLHNKHLVDHNLYICNERVLVRALHRSKRTAWRYHIVVKGFCP